MKRSKPVFLITLLAWSSLTQASISIEDAVHLSVARPGFQLISQKISQDYLTDVANQPINDFEDDVGYGIQAYFSGVSYSIDFRSVDITPQPEHLHAHLDFNSIRVHIDTIKFVKKSGITLKTTCKDTTMTAGSRGMVQLDANLYPRVEANRVKVDIPEVVFDIPDELYDIDGPHSCSGSLGIGEVIKFSLHKALEKANGKITESAKARVREFGPSVASQLQAIMSISAQMNLGGSGGIPTKYLTLSTLPHSIRVTSNDADFSLDSTVNASKHPFEKTIEDNAIKFGDAAAAFSVRLSLINELLSQATPLLPARLPLDTAQSPLDKIFARESLAAVLPDLNQIELDSDELPAALGFGGPPRFELRRSVSGDIVLGLLVPDLRIFLDITQAGKRRPYFEFQLRTSMGLKLEIQGDSFLVAAVPPGEMQAGGQWAVGYSPTIDIFEADVARMLFSTLVEALYNAGPLTRIQLPNLTLGPSGSLRMGSTFVSDDFIGFTLMTSRGK